MKRFYLKSLASVAMIAAFGLSSAWATSVCPTASLADVIALGNCTISDTTFTWGPPQLPPNPVWNIGPFAGDTVLGPSASQVTFTPVVSSTSPGFTLAGPFSVHGGGFGNFMDVSFGYFQITAPDNFDIAGRTLLLTGANVSTDNPNNRVTVDLGGPVVFLNGTGDSQLSDSDDLTPFTAHSLFHILSIKAYNYSSNPNSVSEFASLTMTPNLVPLHAAVPEPATLLLLGSGLAGLGLWGRIFKGN